jgi:hypothetical protein
MIFTSMQPIYKTDLFEIIFISTYFKTKLLGLLNRRHLLRNISKQSSNQRATLV